MPRSPGPPGSGTRAGLQHLHHWFFTLTPLLLTALCYLMHGMHGMRSWLSIFFLLLAPLGAQQRLGTARGSPSKQQAGLVLAG